MFEWFMKCRASPYVQWGIYISGTEHNWKLKFSMETHLTSINAIFEYCHGSVNLDDEDVLYLKYWNVSTCGIVLKNEMATIFFSKNLFSSPVGSLCHTRGVVRRLSSVIRRVSSVSTITTRNN